MSRARILLPLILVLLGSSRAYPHIVPKDTHDRTITVRLQDDTAPGRVKVVIVYRLELDEWTAQKDMEPYKDEVDAGLFANNAAKYYGEYTRIFAPGIAAHLAVAIGKVPLELKLIERSQTLREDQGEDKGKSLGHLRCTFIFEADVPLAAGKNLLRVHEQNYPVEAGQIRFSFENRTKLRINRAVMPDPEQNKVHFLDELRKMTVDFDGVPVQDIEATTVQHEDKREPIHQDEPKGDDDDFLRTFREIRESNAGMLIMLLVFAGLGAAHALTPGHGKTLVAAYLVGEHGTVWHALTLGLVTTITHTGVVLAIALVLFFLPEAMSGQARQAIQTGLGLVLGISVTCLGFWLLLQRLSGRADHIHLSSGTSSKTKNGRLGWWGIIVLGMNGGIIPCWDAVAILVAVIGSSEFWLALPALLAFSAGLAGVLVLIGILVVQFRNFAGSRWGEGRFVRSLPFISAVLVTGMGLYLSYASMR